MYIYIYKELLRCLREFSKIINHPCWGIPIYGNLHVWIHHPNILSVFEAGAGERRRQGIRQGRRDGKDADGIMTGSLRSYRSYRITSLLPGVLGQNMLESLLGIPSLGENPQAFRAPNDLPMSHHFPIFPSHVWGKSFKGKGRSPAPTAFTWGTGQEGCRNPGSQENKSGNLRNGMQMVCIW